MSCRGRPKTDIGISFHTVPVNRGRKKEWDDAVGFTIPTHGRVFSDRFRGSDYMQFASLKNILQHRLRITALPSIGLDISGGTVLDDSVVQSGCVSVDVGANMDVHTGCSTLHNPELAILQAQVRLPLNELTEIADRVIEASLQQLSPNIQAVAAPLNTTELARHIDDIDRQLTSIQEHLGDWLTVKRRKQRSKEAPKNSDPALEAQQRSPRRPPPLPKQHLKVILRTRDGLVFSKWPTPVIARAVLTAGGYPRTTPTQNLIVRIESKQNIAVVSTSSEDMAARIRDINTVHLGAKEYAVATHIAPPANSARGVAHGIPQGTTDAELMRGLYAHKRNILQARMLGPCATALITFEGRMVPRSKTPSHVTSKEQQVSWAERCLPKSQRQNDKTTPHIQPSRDAGTNTNNTVQALAVLVQELRVEIAELQAQLKEERSRNKPPAQESSPEPRTPPQPPQRASTASVVQETVEKSTPRRRPSRIRQPNRSMCE
ncbi:hypothetical protein HPB49_007098 [Dermacentor silvarum]|uniref:Uncharacterized protein n=1 Tax=Dermacentor silvarum TaxID=543639 RepID=A0ACB8CVM5_DERSI|nr:hypothetical protein HPB49_007098 [Dermacentor silvarum]